MAETLVLLSLTVSEIITQNGMKTPPAEFGTYSNISFKKCHFPPLIKITYYSILNQHHTCMRDFEDCAAVVLIFCLVTSSTEQLYVH
jgi:hypothetical protein